MREGATVAQIIDLARVGAIGELQEEYVRGVISDYLKPNQKAKTETIDGKKIVSEHESKFDRYVASLEFIEAMFDALNIINETNYNNKVKKLDEELKKILEEKKLTIPPSPPPRNQYPRMSNTILGVIKEGEQPKKPTLDEIGDRIRASKNYRIAEKDGVFWIEGLKYVKPIAFTQRLNEFVYGKQYDWIGCDTEGKETGSSLNPIIYVKIKYPTLVDAENKLKKIIDSDVEKSKQSNETKYHYL
jgi:hypothetical protein